MGKHALLSASSSRRWLFCTPSARLEEQFQDEPGSSVYAEEGTAAHTKHGLNVHAVIFDELHS